MKSIDVDNFLFINRIKDRVTFWRILSICLIFIFAILIFNIDLSNKKQDSDYIAKIKIDGTIWSNSFDEEKLAELEKDDNVKAIILEIDSPGGEVVSSEILYSFFKKISAKKPVVATIKSLGASGAYMVALASEYIVAYNTSLIGSIGVLMQSVNVNDLLNKVGVDVKLYKSSKFKAAPNMFEKADEEVNLVIDEEIGEVYNYFLDIFMESRKIDRKDALDIANGQVYVGKQALNFKLIDKIGDINDLLIYLEQKEIKTKNIIDYSIAPDNNIMKKIIRDINKEKAFNSKKLLFIYN